MAKKDQDQQTEQDVQEVQGEQQNVEAGESGAQTDQQQAGEPNQLNQEMADPNAEQRVVNQGEVQDPGNSGLVGAEGVVDGQADKPNG